MPDKLFFDIFFQSLALFKKSFNLCPVIRHDRAQSPCQSPLSNFPFLFLASFNQNLNSFLQFLQIRAKNFPSNP